MRKIGILVVTVGFVEIRAIYSRRVNSEENVLFLCVGDSVY